MLTYQISCSIGTTDPTSKLGLEIWLDDTQLYNTNHVTHESLPLVFRLTEDEKEHELKFVMKGKTADHTQVNESGDIIKDASLTINNLSFEDIELAQIFVENAVYTHDFNGTQDTVNDQFYGTMGCNGTVSLKFETPIYIWFLEKI